MVQKLKNVFLKKAFLQDMWVRVNSALLLKLKDNDEN